MKLRCDVRLCRDRCWALCAGDARLVCRRAKQTRPQRLAGSLLPSPLPQAKSPLRRGSVRPLARTMEMQVRRASMCGPSYGRKSGGKRFWRTPFCSPPDEAHGGHACPASAIHHLRRWCGLRAGPSSLPKFRTYYYYYYYFYYYCMAGACEEHRQHGVSALSRVCTLASALCARDDARRHVFDWHG